MCCKLYMCTYHLIYYSLSTHVLQVVYVYVSPLTLFPIYTCTAGRICAHTTPYIIPYLYMHCRSYKCAYPPYIIHYVYMYCRLYMCTWTHRLFSIYTSTAGCIYVRTIYTMAPIWNITDWAPSSAVPLIPEIEPRSFKLRLSTFATSVTPQQSIVPSNAKSWSPKIRQISKEYTLLLWNTI